MICLLCNEEMKDEDSCNGLPLVEGRVCHKCDEKVIKYRSMIVSIYDIKDHIIARPGTKFVKINWFTIRKSLRNKKLLLKMKDFKEIIANVLT